MSATRWRVSTLALGFILLLAACQPIQGTPSNAAEAANATQLIQATYPTGGIRVGLPAEWPVFYEADTGVIGAASEVPPPEPQESNDFWSYLMEEPIAYVIFANVPAPTGGESDLGVLLLERFKDRRSSGNHFNPDGSVTVVEEPTALTINGQPAARAVVQATDRVLGKPFLMHIWAIQNGERIVYVSSALLESNEAQFAPLVETIVKTVEVSEPGTLAKPTPVATGEISPGMTVTATLGHARPDEMERHYWRFVAEEGKRYLITLTPLTAYTDIAGDVVDANGDSSIGYEFDYGFNDWVEEFMYVASEGGERYIVVRNYFQDPGDYSVQLKEAP